MLVQGLIPFFLVARVPLEDGVSPGYGVEYIFTVNMNMMWTRESINPFGFRVLSRLHCIPKRNELRHILSCRLEHNESINIGRNEGADDFSNQWKNVTDEPIELVFNQKEGIVKMIVNQKMKTYNLNILRLVIEHLNPGDDFRDMDNSTFEGVARSTIGRCNVVFKISHRLGNAVQTRHDFDLFLLPPSLELINDETIVIDKTTNLNNCTCYAEHYYRKYGDTMVCEHLKMDLESMTNRMEISKTNFVSSTTRKGTVLYNSNMYNVVETTTVTLESAQLTMREPPAIVNPGETKIIANYDVKSISTDDKQL